MQIRRHKSFEKDYKKLKTVQRDRLKKSLALFIVDPMGPDLYNHPLTGEWAGYRSIAFGGNWRAHYKLVNVEAIFVACGTHSQLYK
jgi:addiction module RelE/StbE family toxin